MVDLEDKPVKQHKHSIAELSRPERAQKERIRQKKKYKGRTRKNEAQDAKYHNWFSPFLWSQIVDIAKHPAVGPNMSSHYIIQVLKQKDPVTFEHLSRGTVDGWIDRSGSKPRWSDATLRRAEKGNHQGHANGGRRGVLVCICFILLAGNQLTGIPGRIS